MIVSKTSRRGSSTEDTSTSVSPSFCLFRSNAWSATVMIVSKSPSGRSNTAVILGRLGVVTSSPA